MPNHRYHLYQLISNQIRIWLRISQVGTVVLEPNKARYFNRVLTIKFIYRFHVGLPTARLSSQALICLNTYTTPTKGPDGGKEGSSMAEAEDLAKRAFTRLATRGENQAIVFL